MSGHDKIGVLSKEAQEEIIWIQLVNQKNGPKYLDQKKTNSLYGLLMICAPVQVTHVCLYSTNSRKTVK